jgi:hypothetical protein
MMLKAIEKLIEVRKAGHKPAVVIVDVGTSAQTKWWEGGCRFVTIAVPDTVPVRELDFRALVGCEVIIVCLTDKDRLRAVTERIVAHAPEVTVLTGTDVENLGHVWSRGAGWRKFGDGAVREVA